MGRRMRFVSSIVALASLAALAGFSLRAPLERIYELRALRNATGLNVDARRIDRVAEGYEVRGLAAWTHGGGVFVAAPLARFVLGRGDPSLSLDRPRFVIVPERLRRNGPPLLHAGTIRVTGGTLVVTRGEIPEPLLALDDLSGDAWSGATGVRYDAHADLLALGGRFPIVARGLAHADATTEGSWHADSLPLAKLGELLASEPFVPTGGWLRDIDVSVGTSLHARARLDDVSVALGAHTLGAVHGDVVLERDGAGTRELGGTLDDGIPFSFAGEVHDLAPDGSWLRNGSRDLASLANLLGRMAREPHVRSVRLEATAPGLAFGQYAITAEHGPLAISVLAIDPAEPTLRLDVALAEDRVISGGERTSALGVRTGAVAGVNGDYFDIGRSYQPQGMVLRDGVLERGPTDRAALVIDRAKHVTFAEFHMRGVVRTQRGTMPITELNDWPPGDVAVITPAFGATLRATPGCTFVSLEPSGPPGTYRVTSVAAMTEARPVRFGIAIGPLVRTPLPRPGETLELDYDLTPHVANAVAGIGGGPILLRHGAWYEDPHAPAPDERDVRWPVIALATQPDGHLLLVALDGRHPERSVGATRPEFAAVLQRLGAVDAMALDSGGSVTLVARAVGDANVSVRNVPSDFSAERWISDALFLYSSAAKPSIVPVIAAPTPVPEARPTL